MITFQQHVTVMYSLVILHQQHNLFSQMQGCVGEPFQFCFFRIVNLARFQVVFTDEALELFYETYQQLDH